jgi:hypothetical protein
MRARSSYEGGRFAVPCRTIYKMRRSYSLDLGDLLVV